MFEKDLSGRETKSFATKADDIGELPLEVCETISGTSGFILKDSYHWTVIIFTIPPWREHW